MKRHHPLALFIGGGVLVLALALYALLIYPFPPLSMLFYTILWSLLYFLAFGTAIGELNDALLLHTASVRFTFFRKNVTTHILLALAQGIAFFMLAPEMLGTPVVLLSLAFYLYCILYYAGVVGKDSLMLFGAVNILWSLAFPRELFMLCTALILLTGLIYRAQRVGCQREFLTRNQEALADLLQTLHIDRDAFCFVPVPHAILEVWFGRGDYYPRVLHQKVINAILDRRLDEFVEKSWQQHGFDYEAVKPILDEAAKRGKYETARFLPGDHLFSLFPETLLTTGAAPLINTITERLHTQWHAPILLAERPAVFPPQQCNVQALRTTHHRAPYTFENLLFTLAEEGKVHGSSGASENR